MYAGIGKVSARTRGAHCCPHLHVATECFFHYKTAYETASPRYEYAIVHISSVLQSGAKVVIIPVKHKFNAKYS